MKTEHEKKENMITARRQNRITALELLYEIEMSGKTLDEALKSKDDVSKINETVLEYVNKVLDSNLEITGLIEENLTNYRLSRLNTLDVIILKGAVAEMLIDRIPHPIVIDEALEIAKIYTQGDDYNSVKIINSVLDKVSKVLKK